MSDSSTPVIVAGVLPEQPLWVLQVAAEYARAFQAELVCVSVDSALHPMQGLADGSLISAPVQPLSPTDVAPFPEHWLQQVGDLLDPLGVRWSARRLVGEPAAELDGIAEELGALMVVVGTRHQGLRGALHHFVAGSIALRLSHRQYRPVVVVPIEPAVAGEQLPWEARKQGITR